MREHGYNVGGEQSGHIILSDYTTTGDGLVAALQVLAVVKQQRQAGVARSATASSRCRRSCKNVRYKNGKPLENAKVATRHRQRRAEARRPAAGWSSARPAPSR